MNNLIEITDLSKRFVSPTEDILLFEDITLNIKEKESAVLTGESGSGKSTFLNILSGLERPTKGQVLFQGHSINGMNEEDLSLFRLDNIGLVFQFHHLLKDFTALENIALPGILRGMNKTEAQERAAELLDMVNLKNRGGHFPSKLSGGEKQRIAIARALFNNPKVVLADEPTGNLDEKNSRIVEEIFFGLLKDQEKALLLVTHDLSLTQYADSHIQIKERRLIQ